VRNTPCSLGLAESARSYFLEAETLPEPVTSVILVPLASAAAEATSVSRRESRSTTANPGQNRTARQAKAPSLAARLRLVLAPPMELLLPGPNSVLSWAGELMPFQLNGVRTLVGSDKLLLADDMGLGKTIQVIAALRVMMVQGVVENALVVAPASVLDQWRQELLKWAPELKAMVIRGSPADRAWQWVSGVHVAIVSYDTLRSDFTDNAQSPVRRNTWGVLVADEAQRIKNRNSTSQAVKGLQRRRSWALTGTPLENSEEELASIIEFVDHGDLVSQSHYSPGLKLRERHRELQLRRKKADVLKDLPPKLTTRLAIELPPNQRRSYDRTEREGIVYLRELGKDIRVQHLLELIQRLKQICNAEPETGESGKFEDIRMRIESLAQQGNRAIIFSQYVSDGFGVDAMASVLREFDPLTFTGALADEERREVIRRFRADDRHKALVVSLRSGGVGLNLQEASYVFHLDRWWNPAVERQAEDRSHRYGQSVPVHVFKYSCANTIEERIDRILESKQELFDELVDDVTIDLGKSLSAQELFGLFGLEELA
jgi:SNF2 family DNA or RNA helicase